MKYSLLILSILFILSANAQKVDFKLNPEISKPSNYSLFNKIDIDGAQSMIMNVTMDINLLPVKIADSDITLENTVNKIKVEINTGMNTMTYDSEKEPENDVEQMLAGEFSKILGNKITSVVNQKGKLISIDILEEYEESVGKRVFNNFFPSLPDEPKSVGESWTNTMIEDEQFGSIESTSIFKEENENGYVLEVIGKIISPDSTQIGKVNSVYTIDKKSNATKSGQVNLSIDIEGATIINEIVITSN